eukprot:scaffold2974_cov181-Amphora_coffeaeformis.AAC.1
MSLFTATTTAAAAAASLPESFLYGVAAGSIGFYGSLWMMQKVTSWSPSLEQRVLALPDKERYYFWTLGPSTLHAMAQVIGTVAFLPRMRQEPIMGWDRRTMVDYGLTGLGPAVYSGLFVGYLMADFFFLGPQKLGTAYVFHHLSASAAWTMSLILDVFQYPGQLLQFCEFSTIFMNLRQLYLTAGYDSSSPQVMGSSLAFFASFAAVRILPLFPLLYKWTTDDFGIIRDEVGLWAALSYSTFLVIHTTLQGMWFRIMLNKLASKFIGGNKKEKEKKEP